jgi:hypothetical protein
MVGKRVVLCSCWRRIIAGVGRKRLVVAVVGCVAVCRRNASLGVCEVGGRRVVVVVVVVAIPIVKRRCYGRYRLQRMRRGGVLERLRARGCVVASRVGRVVVVGSHGGRWPGGEGAVREQLRGVDVCRGGPESAADQPITGAWTRSDRRGAAEVSTGTKLAGVRFCRWHCAR